LEKLKNKMLAFIVGFGGAYLILSVIFFYISLSILSYSISISIRIFYVYLITLFFHLSAIYILNNKVEEKNKKERKIQKGIDKMNTGANNIKKLAEKIKFLKVVLKHRHFLKIIKIIFLLIILIILIFFDPVLTVIFCKSFLFKYIKYKTGINKKISIICILICFLISISMGVFVKVNISNGISSIEVIKKIFL